MTDGPDHKRLDLYGDAEVGKLVKTHQRLVKTADTQASKLEEHHTTPYSGKQAQDLHSTMRALALVSTELRLWHEFLYPERKRDRS